MHHIPHSLRLHRFSTWLVFLLAVLMLTSTSQAWWNPDWTVRKKITIDTGATGVPINDPIGTTAVLIRLHDGDFQFAAAKDDGADIRFVAADDKTVLTSHIEKYDSLLNEAFVWVKVPDLKPGASTSIWLYYGNSGDKAVKTDNPKGTFDADTVLVWHLAEKGVPPFDSSPSSITGTNAGTPVEGSLIGGGLRFDGSKTVTIPADAALTTAAGGAFTWSAWIKPGALAPNAVIYSRHDGGNSLLIGLDNGVPYVAVNGSRSPAGAPVAVSVWRNLAVVSTGSQITIYLDGESYATLAAATPALTTAALLGNDGTPGVDPAPGAAAGFTGELDELDLSKVARPAGLVKFAAISQNGSDLAGKLVSVGADEASPSAGGGEIAKHFSLISDISKSLTFDGWVVIGLCALLALVGWIVTVDKLLYLTRIKKATDVFLKQWEHVSGDLTLLDHSDQESISSIGGKAGPKVQRLMRQSPLYHIYHLGSKEIQQRVARANGNFKGLSERSMQAIRTSLDSGLTREVQNLNNRLVFLTIGIAGGPYLGLLGTVIGVMITFAVIARSGAVEVNSIAPGIAGALLATVAGLAVAIPALFAYSYINSRIKDAVSEMQIFIDEFVAKIAEFYPSAGE